MGVGALIPIVTGAIGSGLGAAAGASLLGESALAGGLASAINTTPLLVGEGGLGGLLGGAVTQQGVGAGIGKVLGGLGGSLAGGALGKAVAPGSMPIPATPGAVPMPSHKGIETPQFQFQTVGPSPSAVIGSRGGGDITELLKRFAR